MTNNRTDYFATVSTIAQILAASAIAADPQEPKVDTDDLRGLVSEDPWVLQRPLMVMEFTASPEPGPLPGGLSWGEIARHCATVAMEADAAHAASDLLGQYEAPDDDDEGDDDDNDDDEVYDGPGIRFLWWAPPW